jgi:molybdate transport system substrate-binding protein
MRIEKGCRPAASRPVPCDKFLRIGLALAMLSFSGCGSARNNPAGRAAAVLRVAAASDLQGVLPKLTERFAAATGITVTPVIGASGQLAQQIRQGAPFDVFLSANMAFVRDLAKAGLIDPDSVRAYARGRLVLVVNRSAGVTVDGLKALSQEKVRRVAIANPEVAPYGKAAQQALEKAGLWEDLKPKVVQADTVRQALQFVQTGNAEAGLVAHSVSGVPEVIATDIDPTLYEPILQGLGITSNSGNGEPARQFARFLLDGGGQSVLTSFGFGPAADER